MRPRLNIFQINILYVYTNEEQLFIDNSYTIFRKRSFALIDFHEVLWQFTKDRARKKFVQVCVMCKILVTNRVRLYE